MGKRNKPKKFHKMGYQQKNAYIQEMGNKYGVNYDNYNTAEGGGGGRYDRYDDAGYEKAVVQAMNNDYSMRESMKYGKDSGNKHFADMPKGISNMSEATDVQRAVAKYGMKEMDHKNMDSHQDAANVADNLFKKSRDKLIASRGNSSSEDTQTTFNNDYARTDRPASTELDEARARVAQQEEDTYNGTNTSNLFDMNYDPAGANNFLNKYKLKLNEQKQRYA